MKRFFPCCLVIALGAASSLLAGDNVRMVQSRLKLGGFYSGEVSGVYNSDTAAAVTRYQIRNGLRITGKLDSQTSNALGVAADKSAIPTPKFGEDVWRYLRKSDQEYIKRLMAEDAGSTQPRKSPTHSVSAPAPASSPALPLSFNRERLRDYVGAFVLAGLDPEVGSETEFFADRVDYFGEHHVAREKIRRDLERYNNRWPERGFWLVGELEVTPVKEKLRVTFPLRYELRNRSRRLSGMVWKTLILEKAGDDDLQVVAVNERKAR